MMSHVLSNRGARAGLVAALALALVCSCASPNPSDPWADHTCAVPATAGLEDQLGSGLCFLQAGVTAGALDRFERGLAIEPSDPRASFLAGFAEILLVVDETYSVLYEGSLTPDAPFTDTQRRLVEEILGEPFDGAPSPDDGESTDESRLGRIARRFEAAGASGFEIDVDGYVLRIRELPLYVDHVEFDTGDAHFLGAIARLYEGLLRFVAAHRMDVPTRMLLNEGERIYSLLVLDVDALLDDPRFFQRRGDHSAEWREASRESIHRALTDVRAAIPAVMAETDNQATPDLEDRPDYLQRSFLTLEGDMYIAGIYGPAPAHAALSLLVKGDAPELAAALRGFFPGVPDTFPDAWDYVASAIDDALYGAPLHLGDVEVDLNALFSGALPARVALGGIGLALGGAGGAELPWTGTGLPSRADADALPWEHPELYEPVPTMEELEADGTRGLDGPSAEVHVGNGYLLAGISREGRLKNLYFPGTTSYDLVPYVSRVRPPYLETEPIPYMGANPEHGSFAGLRVGGELEWLMDRLDHRHVNPQDLESRAIRPRYPEPGVAIVDIDYDDPAGLSVHETSFAAQAGDATPPTAIIRRFVVSNQSDAPIDGDFVYYGAFDVGDVDQYMLGARFDAIWVLSDNDVRPEGDDAIVWSGPGWREHPRGSHAALRMSGLGPLGVAERGIGRLDEEDRGAFDQAVAGAPSDAPIPATRFGNGYLSFPLGALAPGESAEVTVVIALGAGESEEAARADATAQAAAALDGGAEASRVRTEAWWRDWIGGCTIPDGLPARELEVMRLAAMALKLSQSAMTGALPELLDSQPMWFMVWPGSAVWQASALDALGRHAEAEAFFDYALDIQSPEGHWRMAYTTLGEYHGAFELEYYMTPSLVWFAWMHWRLTGDDAWLERVWPDVSRAADFVVRRRADNGLMYASPDFVEDMTGYRQSAFTNTIAVSGLLAAREMARALSDDRADVYEETARSQYEAVLRTFWNADSGRWQAYHDMQGTWGDGAEPSMVFPYGVFAFDDPRVDGLVAHLDEEVARQDFVTFQTGSDWTPGLMMHSVFYANHALATGRQASRDNVRFIIDGVLSQRTLAGFIPERFFGHGVMGSGKPLLWPHAAFILTELALSRGENPIPMLPPAGVALGVE